MKEFLSFAAAALVLAGCAREKTAEVADLVDPMIGTGAHGHTFPGATTPFGMVQLSPDTGLEGWDWCSGYHYTDSTIIGFTHTHLSGTGRSDLMDVMLMPHTGAPKLSPEEYTSAFSHADEVASPGYYKVLLKDHGVTAELTATPRAGFHRYTFPADSAANVILDLAHHYATDSVINTTLTAVGDSVLTGARFSRGWGEPGERFWSDQHIYYAIKFSRPFSSSTLAVAGEGVDPSVAAAGVKGPDVKFVASFEPSAEPLLVKVGISAVSEENALANLAAEIPAWDFDGAAASARALWNDELGKIKVEGPEDAKRIFYTAMYHAMTTPYLYNDVNGEYRGSDGKVHKAEGFNNYTVLSLWDTFRAANPLYTITNPKLASDLVNSMLAQYDEYGLLPVWSLWSSETNCMIGYHAIPVIVDAYFKGIGGFDAEKAYQAMKTSAMQDDFGIDLLKKYGYIPNDLYNRSVATALEYCYDDWCISRMAEALGHEEDARYFAERAASYAKYFDPEFGLMNGVDSKGRFRRPFDPAFASYGECDWIEGNSLQFSFFVPHDVSGLIGLMGGNGKFDAAIDRLFTEAVDPGDDAPIDISGIIGGYAHGNEPSHHVAYLHNYTGNYAATQRRVREIADSLYTSAPDGLCGNDDCGQMSAWYVFSALGFYPVNPAEGVYVLGVPLLESATIKAGEKPFTMKAVGFSPENRYVTDVRLDGKPYDKLYITHSDILRGAELEFVIGPEPKNIPGAKVPPSAGLRK